MKTLFTTQGHYVFKLVILSRLRSFEHLRNLRKTAVSLKKSSILGNVTRVILSSQNRREKEQRRLDKRKSAVPKTNPIYLA
jgi:hypothetical protein